MPQPGQELFLKRRLNRWQIFFIALGGIIGIGFFRGSSKSLAIAGPVGALIAVVVVGVIAVAVMECICELVVLWPIPNAMVEYVKAFVDEDLGTAVGIMYWYTYCVTFSALIISAADLTNYWHTQQIFKALIYVLGPIVLMLINAFPVEVFGWIEFFGGILKLALVLGTIVLMFAINGGVGGTKIGTEYFVEGVTFNSKVASASYQAVFEAIPIATFAYIGIELVTTTAFEALDPDELRLPAANVGWFSTVLYTLATGSFVANVSWQDQNLPKLFQQALTIITDADAATKFQEFFAPEPETHASPLIALLRTGFVFLPSFLNGCFMYSALSCANTALYVASRQLYGMTRTITVDSDSGFIRRGFHWMSSVHYRTKAPWPAIAISGLLLCWLPFLRIHDDDDEFLKDVQDVLINIGSVSCILVWCSQCVAFISFFHWRQKHQASLERLDTKWEKLFEKKNGGHFQVFQPFFAYLGALACVLIVVFFNTVSLWNGKRLSVKAISAFVSPLLVFAIYIVKKLSRRDGKRFRFLLDLSNFTKFEDRIQALEDAIYPGEMPDNMSMKSGRTDIETTPSTAPFHPGDRGDVPGRQTKHNRNSYGRSDLILDPSQTTLVPTTTTTPVNRPGMRRDLHPAHLSEPEQYGSRGDLRAEYTAVPEHDGPRSDLQSEYDSTRGYDTESIATSVPAIQDSGLLSPSSASSRRGLGNIHEDNEAEMSSYTPPQSKRSRGRSRDETR